MKENIIHALHSLAWFFCAQGQISYFLENEGEVQMYISSFDGTVQYLQFEQYKERIRKIIYSHTENEIGIYARESIDGWDKDYPCTLSILVKEKQAVINFFSEGNEEFFASIGDFEKDGTVSWEIGNNVYSATKYQIISLEMAVECAVEFFLSQEKPTCIAWEEL